MTEHNLLTGAALHEPKGVAAAAEGQVYIADGAGSGTWTLMPHGWGFYKDDATEQTFNTTAAKLSINGGDASTDETYLPLAIRGSGSLWDTTTDDITPIALGDAYELRVDLPITARTSANYAEIILDIGSTAGVTVPIVTRRIETTRTPPYTASVGFPIFCGATFLANGGQLFLKTDTGSIGITAPGITLVRIHGEVS